jgi:hypothetical protein
MSTDKKDVLIQQQDFGFPMWMSTFATGQFNEVGGGTNVDDVQFQILAPQ